MLDIVSNNDIDLRRQNLLVALITFNDQIKQLTSIIKIHPKI